MADTRWIRRQVYGPEHRRPQRPGRAQVHGLRCVPCDGRRREDEGDPRDRVAAGAAQPESMVRISSPVSADRWMCQVLKVPLQDRGRPPYHDVLHSRRPGVQHGPVPPGPKRSCRPGCRRRRLGKDEERVRGVASRVSPPQRFPPLAAHHSLKQPHTDSRPSSAS